jgi:glutamate carboxypeptidase
MKAGLVTAIDALERVADPSRVAVLVTGDEETGSPTSRALIEDVAREAAAVLVLEPSLDGALKVGRKGGGIYELSFRGLAAHAGLEPERGRNALLAMASWAVRLPELADLTAGTTVTPTRASSGTAVNVVPDAARLSVDVRGATAAELDRVDRAIRRWSAGEDGAPPGPDVDVEVGGGVNRPPLEESGSVGLVARCRRVAAELGLPEPATATVGGGSDGNFTAALGVPTLDGLGPSGNGAHTAYEWVEIDAIGRQAALVAGLVEQIINEND